MKDETRAQVCVMSFMGYNRSQIAARLGLSERTISRVLRGAAGRSRGLDSDGERSALEGYRGMGYTLEQMGWMTGQSAAAVWQKMEERGSRRQETGASGTLTEQGASGTLTEQGASGTLTEQGASGTLAVRQQVSA